HRTELPSFLTRVIRRHSTSTLFPYTTLFRSAMHCEHAKEVIRWLEEQPQVERVLYPPLPSHPGHEIWKRDFTGANGLLSVAFKPDRKSTRLNSSHVKISYAVFCLKKKNALTR